MICLQRIQDITIRANRFEFFPQILEKLPCLREVDIAENGLTSFSQRWVQLSGKVKIDISDNPLKEVGLVIKSHHQLEYSPDQESEFPQLGNAGIEEAVDFDDESDDEL